MTKKAIDSMNMMNNSFKKFNKKFKIFDIGPSTIKVGSLYHDMLSNEIHYYNGKGWIVVNKFEVAQDEREMLDSTYISFEENNKQDLYCEYGFDLEAEILDIICFELLEEDYDRAMEVVNEFE